MSTESLSRDEAAIGMWDGAYDASALGGQANLWGDPPVPYAQTAAELFAAADAAVILDLPCGDGRNLPPLAAGAPILLAGDTSPKAMAIARSVVERAGVQRTGGVPRDRCLRHRAAGRLDRRHLLLGSARAT